MTAQPASNPDPGERHEVLRLGRETAAIVPLTELLEEAEIEATLAAPREWTAAGRPGAISHQEAMAEPLAGPVKIGWSPAARAPARRYMADQDGTTC
jgi:hypothetical protein